MSSIVDYTDRSTCIILEMVQVQLFEPNHEGLGLQDEYLRSDGVGRDFLKLMLEDLYILLLKRWKRTDITSFKTENCF
jgi:hypothetical protein